MEEWSNTMRLKGKVALITGGTSGIGSATAVRFGKEGASVVITGRNPERGAEVVADIEATGAEAMFIQSDVRLADDCRRAVEETLARFGKIDVLFNNAGVFHPKTVPDCTEEEWDETIDSSLKGAFLMSKYALPSMIEQGSGSIIHTSSGWGILGGNEAASYCAAKGGLVVMAKAMAMDHGKHGIRVNCVCPGDVLTPMLYDDAEKRGMTWAGYEASAVQRPLGRIGTVDEIADAVLFLASDESSFVTGESLVVDGGGVAG
ncbi:MAG: glucose 1-dehydrogenase [Woeseiaceae bacterium]|nr:glucose 1-dehydrogenase [Woeseiaceae bacterium]NIP20903.1 glucose 1-dehydrogenase [Woeseiaceae bacterium]NIS89670.1 glucose 1-dehydrogenase [Woeseiaceae bacterium]